MKRYICTTGSLPVLRRRLGEEIDAIGVEYGAPFSINGVTFSFHPAGHVPGSAQIRVEHRGEVWVFSGDYKTEDDGVSEAFQPVRCHTFISECTFGLPVFRWRPQSEIMGQINRWWRINVERGLNSMLFAYSLGKAQRILSQLDGSVGPIAIHSSITGLCEAIGFSIDGFDLVSIDSERRPLLVLAPPLLVGSAWTKRFRPFETGLASGWMTVRGMQRRRAVDVGFSLSDHADFRGLTEAIRMTGAERVLLTHGYTAAFSKWISEQGVEAHELGASFDSEADDNG